MKLNKKLMALAITTSGVCTLQMKAQLTNSYPTTGNTTIGSHIVAGNGNELWSVAPSLYVNYQSNASKSTYFWNGAAGTGFPILSLINSGKVGIATTTPNFNLQVHGLVDYVTQTIYDRNGGVVSNGANYGKTSRIGLTNLTTGSGEFDGAVLRMSDNNLTIVNQEAGGLFIGSSGAYLNFNGASDKAYFGSSIPLAGVNYAYLNVQGSGDNGLFVRAANSGKYALGLKVYSNNENVIEAYGTSATIKTFTVQGSGSTLINATGVTATGNVFLVQNSTRKLLQLTNDGILRARQIIVDQANWADYVFKPNYDLMSLEQVKKYIKENGHLPGIPSAKEIAETGINLSEMNTKLMEKVEELTLYIIQQQEKTKALEEKIMNLEKK